VVRFLGAVLQYFECEAWKRALVVFACLCEHFSVALQIIYQLVVVLLVKLEVENSVAGAADCLVD
jgi:hypothetical protein